MKFELAIFDLDGTLVDTIEDLGTAVNHALSLNGLPLHGTEEYRMMVGNGIRKLVFRAMPDDLKEDDAMLESLLADFVSYYSEHLDVNSHPYPGIPEMLESLQNAGMKLAVASNKFQQGTDKIIRRFFPDINFLRVCGGRDGVPLKPDPTVVLDIIASSGVDSRHSAMIGDSATDMLTAKAAGICGIAVPWGFRPADAAAECSMVADSAVKLEEILLG